MEKFKKYDAIVICSTLNQMVNYIPIMLHEIDTKNIYNIRRNTPTNKIIKHKFDYGKWDENFKEVLGSEFDCEIQNINFNEKEISNHTNITNHIKKHIGEKIEGKKVLWNITGGQRHFVMAITEYVLKYKERKDDTIMYYDGDREKIYYYSQNENNIKPFNLLEENLNYEITIPKALRLMGFKVKNREDLREPSDYYKEINGEKTEEHKWYTDFHKFYSENEELRKLLVNSNRFKNDKEESTDKNSKKENKITKSVLNKILEEIKASGLKEDIKNMFKENALKTLEASLGDHCKGKVFGYMLEKMTLYNLMDIIESDGYKDIISDIDADISVDSAIKPKNKSLDQFDVMMATKTGKIIMLECKSGGMSGDNAKSNNYSTYAIAGVYGTPILVVPVIDGDSKSEKIHYQNNKNVYKYVGAAIDSAERASIDYKCINELSEILENYRDIEKE
ncbi:DNA-binding protein [Clostridium sp.]|jgi:hypothetical protein|uniref:DNA-binding protein n=1 Tax=Clostridium sp. TaxID=1506 RepID=UPI002FDCB3FF